MKQKKHKSTVFARGKKKNYSDIRPRVVISGYYGFDNLGDELILRVLVEELKAHQIHITVLSQNPAKTAQEYGVTAIKRTSFIDIVDALAQANLFISGGGGLFQDATGPMSTLYYGSLIHLARFFEVPVCFWAQGIGPLRSKLARRLTGFALNRCEVVLVRDEKSATLVESLSHADPVITADPVWLLNLSKTQPSEAKAEKKLPRKKKTTWKVGISLRTWHDLTPERLQALAECLTQVAIQQEKTCEWVLLPFQEKEDAALLKQFGIALAEAAHRHNRPEITITTSRPTEALRQLAQCDALFGMRFHSLILGLLHKIPVYGLIYDPKVAALLEMFSLQGTPIHELAQIQAESVASYLKNYPTVDLKPFKQQSRQNFKVLRKLLDIPEAELLI